MKDDHALSELRSTRVGLVAHPASVDKKLNHSVDLLSNALEGSLKCAFGPQHGMRGDKQDNMIESSDYTDPNLNIPVFSLYGEVRRPTPEMMEHFDTLVFDLQDLGCRIYTFLTTLFYCMEDCAKAGKSIWVLDRPNPAGRPVEGNLLEDNFFSFVGGAKVPMRHGLTLGEAANWYKSHKGLDLGLRVIQMNDYRPNDANKGWPDLPWINPSPNAPNVNMARVYPGSVMVEGTTYSEGRGTTRPLEVFGAPHIEPEKFIKKIYEIMNVDAVGFQLRPCYFEPTFHKFKGELCAGLQVHADTHEYDHKKFKPYRLFAAIFKAAHQLYPDFDMWSQPPYEYEHDRTPIDLISGSTFLREWVENNGADFIDLVNYLTPDEQNWAEKTRSFLMY